jgi:hypothetical protein
VWRYAILYMYIYIYIYIYICLYIYYVLQACIYFRLCSLVCGEFFDFVNVHVYIAPVYKFYFYCERCACMFLHGMSWAIYRTILFPMYVYVHIRWNECICAREAIYYFHQYYFIPTQFLSVLIVPQIFQSKHKIYSNLKWIHTWNVSCHTKLLPVYIRMHLLDLAHPKLNVMAAAVINWTSLTQLFIFKKTCLFTNTWCSQDHCKKHLIPRE